MIVDRSIGCQFATAGAVFGIATELTFVLDFDLNHEIPFVPHIRDSSHDNLFRLTASRRRLRVENTVTFGLPLNNLCPCKILASECICSAEESGGDGPCRHNDCTALVVSRAQMVTLTLPLNQTLILLYVIPSVGSKQHEILYGLDGVAYLAWS